MGADIYLKAVYDPHAEKVRPKIDRAIKARNKYIGEHSISFGNDDAKSKQLQAKVIALYDELHSVGYFRDSYNNTSLFWLLGLSWWQLSEELCDGDRNLPVDKARELLARLEAMPVTPEMVEAWAARMREKGGVVFDDEDNSVKGWGEMFAEKHKKFCALLRQSIELNEPLYWSV